MNSRRRQRYTIAIVRFMMKVLGLKCLIVGGTFMKNSSVLTVPPEHLILDNVFELNGWEGAAVTVKVPGLLEYDPKEGR